MFYLTWYFNRRRKQRYNMYFYICNMQCKIYHKLNKTKLWIWDNVWSINAYVVGSCQRKSFIHSRRMVNLKVLHSSLILSDDFVCLRFSIQLWSVSLLLLKIKHFSYRIRLTHSLMLALLLKIYVCYGPWQVWSTSIKSEKHKIYQKWSLPKI